MTSNNARGQGRMWLALILGIAAVLAVVAALAGMRAMAASASPEKLSKEELLSRVAKAPEKAPDFSATLTVEQSLIPAQLLEAAGQESGFAASGPQTARVWYGGPDGLRAELQGENGDRVFVHNGERAWAYNGATNTLKTGERPPEARTSGQPDVENPPNPAEVDRMLAELAPTSKLTQGTPVRYAGREAYVLTLSPRDGDSTLVDRGHVLIDSETFLPLELSLYAKGRPDPVFSWRVSDLDVGPVPAERFTFQAPPGAKVVPFDDGRKERSEPGMRAGAEQPSEVKTVAKAQSRVDFEIDELANPPDGRELTGVYLKGTDGVALTYGSGWGTVVLAQGPQNDGASAPRRMVSGGNDLALPTVDLGGGVKATELSTPVGTAIQWNAGGVSYVLAGSVPAADLERAARELR
jgi:outer membrane lipoprotein-sorting protein